jgi:hypothetical protein
LDKSALGWNREGSDLDGGRELGVWMDGEVLLTVGRGARRLGGLVIQIGEGCCGGQPSQGVISHWTCAGVDASLFISFPTMIERDWRGLNSLQAKGSFSYSCS